MECVKKSQKVKVDVFIDKEDEEEVVGFDVDVATFFPFAAEEAEGGTGVTAFFDPGAVAVCGGSTPPFCGIYVSSFVESKNFITLAFSFAKYNKEERAKTAPKGEFVFAHTSVAFLRAGPGVETATAIVLPSKL